jgi:hypothetical protein
MPRLGHKIKSAEWKVLRSQLRGRVSRLEQTGVAELWQGTGNRQQGTGNRLERRLVSMFDD